MTWIGSNCAFQFDSFAIVFSPGTLVYSTNKTDHQDIAEILLKVALNTIEETNFPIFIC
jgi:hypothetical protein